MPDIGYASRAPATRTRQDAPHRASARPRRASLLLIVAAAAIASFFVTSPTAEAQAVARSGPELAHLLRAMAGIKAIAAVALVAVTYWRLAAPVGRTRFAVYALACAAMAAGPGLIWGMDHVKLGALFLHGGLIVVALMLWRDPAMGTRIQSEIARRRARLQA